MTQYVCVSPSHVSPNHLLLASIRHINSTRTWSLLTCFHVHFKLVFLHIWMATFIPLISCILIFISVPPVCQLTNIVKQTSYIFLGTYLFLFKIIVPQLEEQFPPALLNNRRQTKSGKIYTFFGQIIQKCDLAKVFPVLVILTMSLPTAWQVVHPII